MTMMIPAILFWLGVAALVYTYAGYPMMLFVISRISRRRPIHAQNHTTPSEQPTVTVIITAYNEERDLAAKLENTLALNYPAAKLDILVASDCSTDGTDDIVREFSRRTNNRVRLHRQPVRLGKTAAQNAAVELAQGDIILFSDATTVYQPDVLKRMLPNFSDSSVGCVAGKLIYVDESRSSIGQGARSYWSYETFIKRHESEICSLIGASGCLYAVRRAAYVPMYPEACSDFLIATKMVEQGLRAVYEPTAVCTEETNRRTDKELKMRVRIITQTFTDLWRHRYMINPMRSGFYAVELFSHKVMRYLVPVFLIVIFFTSLALASRSWFYLAVCVAQVLCYAAALAGAMFERVGVQSRVLALPHYFVLANLASLIAFYKFLRGERFAKWEPIRESSATNAV